MPKMIRGNRGALVLGLALLAYALFSAWGTARFVSGARMVDGRVYYSGSSSTFIVAVPYAPGRTDYVLVRKPALGLFRAGKPISILINPSVAHDRLQPEFYSIIPVTARVASRLHLWGWTIFLLVLAGSILTLYFLSALHPRQFRFSVRIGSKPGL